MGGKGRKVRRERRMEIRGDVEMTGKRAGNEEGGDGTEGRRVRLWRWVGKRE